MDKQSISLITKTIPLIAMIWIGTIICDNAVGETKINFSDIDKQDIQKLLTNEEKAWLTNHKTIRIAGPKAFPPFHYYEEDGILKGMASDYINLISEYLDIQLDIRTNLKWNIVLKEAEEHKIDLISCSAKTIKREAYLNFSEPYLSFPLVIITKTDSPFISGIDDLHDKKVAFIKGNVTYDWIMRDNIKAIPYFVKTPKDALKDVSLGYAEAYIANLASATYLIRKHGLANLKIAAPAFNENYNLHMAIRKDWPELVSIINKIFAVMTTQQHSQIRDRWLSIEYEHGIRKTEVIKWILGISCIFITIFAVILMWNRRLNREIHRRKQAEEEVQNNVHFLETIDRINRMIQKENDVEPMLWEITEIMLSVFGCDRAWLLFPLDPDALTYHVPIESVREGCTGACELNLEVPMKPGADEVCRTLLASSGPVTFGSGCDKSLYKEVTEQFGVHSQMATGVYPKVGKPWMFGMHQCSHARVWKKAEKKLFNEIAQRIGDGLTSLLSLRNLQESEGRYRGLVESSSDWIWEVNAEGIYTYASPQVETILGYKSEEVVDKTLFDLMAPAEAERVAIIIGDLIKAGKPITAFEKTNLHKNGRHVVLETSSVPVLDRAGAVTGYRGMDRDITDRKQAEEEKLQAQKIAAEHTKLALVGQVAGKMAHDFNNILGVIMGNTELTLLDCQEPKTRKTLELIFEQTLRGSNLTKNLVAFAKDQEPKQEFFRINEKIDLVLNLLKKDLEGIEIIKEVKAGMPDLLADPGMIQHGLVNLIQNSIHALSRVKHPTIIIRTYTMDDNICFEIEDNGCGIPKEHLANIYEPSFTLKGSKDVTDSYKNGIKGTGYGMANVKKYIEQHKGSIFVESKLDSGTKFIIKIPIIKKELSAKEKTGLQEETVHFEKYILLVEDEPSLSDVQYRILTDEPCNHKVDVAPNGQMAKDLFDRNKYDFVSLDYILPGGINGMDVYHHIRKTNQTVPILFISGNIEFLESIKELKQKDAYIDHLSKPCQNKDYVNSINSLLKKTSAAQ